MAAGLGFKTFTNGEVLSSADVNGYLMQGVLVFASAAARNSAITSPQEGQFAFTKDTNGLWYYDGAAWVASGATGDIEGVTAGVGISGGGTSGTVTVTNSMATEITASGDIIVGTGSGTFDNLPIGTTGQLLTADTTVSPYKVKWATPAGGGGMTVISTGTGSGSSFAISSIPSTYKDLVLILQGMTTISQFDLRVRPANANIVYGGVAYDDNSGGAMYGNGAGVITCGPRDIDSSSGNNAIAITISNYASTSYNKAIGFEGGYYSASGFFNGIFGAGLYQSNSAISSITIDPNGGTFNSCNYILYGVS